MFFSFCVALFIYSIFLHNSFHRKKMGYPLFCRWVYRPLGDGTRWGGVWVTHERPEWMTLSQTNTHMHTVCILVTSFSYKSLLFRWGTDDQQQEISGDCRPSKCMKLVTTEKMRAWHVWEYIDRWDSIPCLNLFPKCPSTHQYVPFLGSVWNAVRSYRQYGTVWTVGAKTKKDTIQSFQHLPNYRPRWLRCPCVQCLQRHQLQ